jgi:hypothetical protein
MEHIGRTEIHLLPEVNYECQAFFFNLYRMHETDVCVMFETYTRWLSLPQYLSLNALPVPQLSVLHGMFLYGKWCHLFWSVVSFLGPLYKTLQYFRIHLYIIFIALVWQDTTSLMTIVIYGDFTGILWQLTSGRNNSHTHTFQRQESPTGFWTHFCVASEQSPSQLGLKSAHMTKGRLSVKLQLPNCPCTARCDPWCVT